MALSIDVVVQTISAAYSPGATSQHLLAAHEACEALRKQPGVHQAAMQIASHATSPEVCHIGYHLLLSAMRCRPPAIREAERLEVRKWLVERLTAPEIASSAPAHLRGKCAETVAEVARLDWPEQWPELVFALQAGCASQSAAHAMLALSTWRHLSELPAQESKDITPARRTALNTALLKVLQEPPEAPVLISGLEEALRQHGSDKRLVGEALGLCRALGSALPVQKLLARGLDRIIFVGLADCELRDSAMMVVADWVEGLLPATAEPEASSQALADVCRFTCQLSQASRTCLFDGDTVNTAFHRHVAQVLSDMCSANASGFVQRMQTTELGAIWQCLLHFLRYPSQKVQVDALAGMCQLMWSKSGGTAFGVASGVPPRPPLEELVAVLYVHILKASSYADIDMDAQRSDWLLRCLGRTSTADQPGTFMRWHRMVQEAFSADCLDGNGSAEERSSLFGALKMRALQLVTAIGTNLTTATSPEGFHGLLQTSAQLLQRAMGGSVEPRASVFQTGLPQTTPLPWWPEVDAAIALVERVAPAILKLTVDEDAKKQKQEASIGTGSAPQLEQIVTPSMSFLQSFLQWTPAGLNMADRQTKEVAENVQYRQLELVAHWSVFYRHVPAAVLSSTLQKLISTVEHSAEGTQLRHRAVDTLVAVARSGVMTKEQIEGLHGECSRLIAQLGPGAAAKFSEAIAAAVAGVDMDTASKANLLESIMRTTTQRWTSSPLTQRQQPEAFAAMLFGPNGIRYIKDAKMDILMFNGVVQTVLQDRSAGEKASTAEGAMTGIIQQWAPGIFAVLLNLAGAELLGMAAASGSPQIAGVAADERALLSALVTLPDDQELNLMLSAKASRLDFGAEAPRPVVPQQITALQTGLSELRGRSIKAASACMRFSTLWTTPDMLECVKAVAGAMQNNRPYIANIILKDIFEAFVPHLKKESLLPNGVPEQAVPALLPQLSESLLSTLRELWGSPQTPAIKGMWATGTASAVHDAALVASVVTFTKSSSKLLASMVGGMSPSGKTVPWCQSWFHAGQKVPSLSSTSQVAANQGAQPAGRRKGKKDRNKNRYAALADEDMADDTAAMEHEQTEDEAPAPVSTLVTAIMRARNPREQVRGVLVEMLRIPQREVVTDALSGLCAWSAQLWACLLRGEDEAYAGMNLNAGSLPTLANFLHAASDALRVLACGVLKPVLQVVTCTPDVAEGEVSMATKAPEDSFVAPSVQMPLSIPPSLLASIRQGWSAYTTCQSSGGKASASQLVSHATPVVVTVLRILTNLLRLQCLRAEQQITVAAVQACAPLQEALQVLRGLPNTTEADVITVLESFQKYGKDAGEAQKQGVRVLLHEASSAFRSSS